MPLLKNNKLPMNPIDIQKLQSLIDNQQWEEAKQLLEKFFRAGIDSGQDNSLLKQTQAYLEASNSLSRQQLEVLDNTIEMLKETDRQKKDGLEAIDLNSARNQIKNS